VQYEIRKHPTGGFMNNPFKQSALAYAAIEKYLRDNAFPTTPVSIDDIFIALGEQVKNRQQVADCIKMHRANGNLGSLREGRIKRHWWADNDHRGLPTPAPADEPAPVVTVNDVPIPTPETTTAPNNTVVIITNGVKITVELL
jgi:hypothetical protein